MAGDYAIIDVQRWRSDGEVEKLQRKDAFVPVLETIIFDILRNTFVQLILGGMFQNRRWIRCSHDFREWRMGALNILRMWKRDEGIFVQEVQGRSERKSQEVVQM